MSGDDWPTTEEMVKAVRGHLPASVFYGDLLQSLLDAHAHELAEQIRALVTHAEDYTCLPCQTHLFAADLIDPEVTT